MDPQERLREKLIELDSDLVTVKAEIQQLLIELREFMLLEDGPLPQADLRNAETPS